MTDRYSHGHHAAVLRSHSWRTAENSAAYLLPRLGEGMDVLDVGCGPGTITADLARFVPGGSVLGIDIPSDVMETAQRERGSDTVRFEVGDVYALGFDDDSFDVVHAHQVLQHLGDPVAALREMRRVLRPGGTLAVRDSDYGGFLWAPEDPRLTRWMAIYHGIATRNGADADAGRRLHTWVRAAGFEDLVVSSSTWTFQDPADRSWWGETWAERVRASEYARQAVEYGLCDAEELESIAAAFLRWVDDPDGVFIVLHCEVLASTR